MERRPRTSPVIPRMASDWHTGGDFSLYPNTKVYIKGADESAIAFVLRKLRGSTGWEFPVVQIEDEKTPYRELHHAIVFEIDPKRAEGPEGYNVHVGHSVTYIHAATPTGLFYGGITFLQLLPPAVFDPLGRDRISWSAPFGYYHDKPRFSWRGVMLDVGRFFFPVPVIKRFLEQMAILKLNKFHWHLTEDQGWRIEIKRYPKLTEVGAWRKESMSGALLAGHNRGDGIPHGGFYTQEEIREVVEYAASLHITVIPEIDMPGHMAAAIAAYPELGCTDQPIEVATEWGVNPNILFPGPETVQFMQNVLEEVLELFPSEFIHIGGDEAVKTQWDNNPRVIALREELGLKDSHELQSWFIRQMDDFLTARGRRLIGWDEILEGGLAQNAAVMSWRSFEGGKQAAKQGHDVVIAANHGVYFDYCQSNDYNKEPLTIGADLRLEDVYRFDPLPAEVFTEEETKHVLGVQAQLWTEYVRTEYKLHYQTFPRLCALAEIAWTPKELLDWDNFRERVKTHQYRLSIMDIAFRPLD
jgi:hexosaminidase